MEPRFEVRYYTTHRQFAEFARKYMTGPRMPMVILFWTVYLLVLSLYIFGKGDYALLPMMLAVGLVYLLFSFMPHWYAFLTRRHGMKQNDGVLPETVITFGDTIELHEGMVHITVEYRKLLRVVQLKHSYVLMIGKRNGVMLDPKGFTKGTFEEFKEFLREVRPDLPLPDGAFPWNEGAAPSTKKRSTKGKTQ